MMTETHEIELFQDIVWLDRGFKEFSDEEESF